MARLESNQASRELRPVAAYGQIAPLHRNPALGGDNDAASPHCGFESTRVTVVVPPVHRVRASQQGKALNLINCRSSTFLFCSCPHLETPRSPFQASSKLTERG